MISHLVSFIFSINEYSAYRNLFTRYSFNHHCIDTSCLHGTFSIFVLFRGLGKDYDAAVMVGGFIGHGLGATPNAMANLDVITKSMVAHLKHIL